jgi:chromosome segregation ATPase/ElaB/YqjD/DUF883 family membrane-anchored ribosome-binding protein
MITEEIVFDEKSGISVEEQKEILTKINGIAEKNRKQLSQTGSQIVESKGKIIINAQKKDAVFPLAVNIAAVVLLLGGALLLVSLNGKKEAQVKTGDAVYNLTERALIEEIRKDTAEKIAAKEKEIASIVSHLSEVDDELSKLYSNNQNLNADQIKAQGRLLAMQNYYRDQLTVLQDERSQILEESRLKEARLRAQLDERTREFATAQQKVSTELESAVSELEKLRTEQEKIAAIDAQISGGLASAKDYIQKKQYDQAAGVIENLRRFCNNNALASSRIFQSRKVFYNQAIDFVEAMINDALKNSGSSSSSGADQSELKTENAQLQEKIKEMQKTIDAQNSGGSGLSNRVSELEANVSTLQKDSKAKDDRIASLEADKTKSASDITNLQNSNAQKDQEITRLKNQVGIAQQALQALQALQE